MVYFIQNVLSVILQIPYLFSNMTKGIAGKFGVLNNMMPLINVLVLLLLLFLRESFIYSVCFCDYKEAFFGEEFNKKFLEELQKIKDEKGADYFRNYPSKDELMGDNLRPTYDTIVGTPNMGRGAESTKQVDTISQHGSRSR